MVWSGLVDQKKVDQLTGQNVIFDILETLLSKNIVNVGSFERFLFVFVVFLSLSLSSRGSWASLARKDILKHRRYSKRSLQT